MSTCSRRLAASLSVVVAGAVSMSGGIAAAGGDDKVKGVTGACPKKGGATIGMATPIPIDLFETYTEVVTDQAENAGHEVISVVGPLPPDPNKQISDVNSLIDRGIDVLIVAPIIPDAFQPVLERARAEDIPVVGIDISEERLDDYATSVTSANFDGARQAALYMGELVGEGGTVAIMNGPELAGRPLVERAEGFAQGAEEAGLEVVDTQIDVRISPESGEEIANAWKQQFPDLDGVLVFGDPSGLGVQTATDDSWNPVVMSMNGEPAAVDAVEAGSLAATFDLVPVVHGYALAYGADRAFCGKKLPDELKIDIVQIDESNAEAWISIGKQRKQAFKMKLEKREGETFVVLPDGFPLPAS